MRLNKIIFLIILNVLFLFLCVPLFPSSGHSGDLWFFQSWGNRVLEKGLAAQYIEGTDYPPLYFYVLKFNAFLSQDLFKNTDIHSSHYNAISKVVPTLANVLIGFGLFFFFRKKYKTAILAMILYIFNFAIIYNTAYWGQVDSVSTLFMFLSILALLCESYIFSTLFLTIATFTKVQSIILLPIIVIVLLKKVPLKCYIKIFLANTLLSLIILLPYFSKGVVSNVFKVMFNSVDYYPYVTVNAYNIWRLIRPQLLPDSWMNGLKDSFVIFGISLKTVGLILFFTYLFIVLYQLWKNSDDKRIILSAASVTFAFFMLPTQIHERYLFYFFAFGAMIASIQRRYLLVYLIASFAYLLNLMMILPFNGPKFTIFYPLQILLNQVITAISFTYLSILVSVINIVIFIYFSYTGIFQKLLRNIKIDISNLKRRVHHFK